MPSTPHLSLLDPAEDQPTNNHHVEDQPPPPVPTKEPQIPISTAPTVTASLPNSPTSCAPLMPLASSDSAPPLYHISISPRDFLAFMDVVRTFSATSTSFAAAHTTLVERMTHTEAAVAQTIAMLAKNNAILVQIQSHLGLPQIPSTMPAQVSLDHPPPAHPAPPITSLDILLAVDTPPASSVAPQPTRDEDDIPPVAHH